MARSGDCAACTESFAFVAIPISFYRQSVGRPFNYVAADEEAKSIANLLKPYGACTVPWSKSREEIDREDAEKYRGLEWVKERLTDWSGREEAGCSVVTWVGHGESDDENAWLAVSSSRQQDPTSGYSPEELAICVAAEWTKRQGIEGSWALIIIEACGAERFIERLVTATNSRTNAAGPVAFVGAGGKGTAFLGSFGSALSAALASYSSNDEVIRIRDLVGRVEDNLAASAVITKNLGGASPLIRPREFSTVITAPQDIYLELKDFLADLAPDQRSHFVPKAQGAEQGELAWHFVGRSEERRQIAQWFDASDHGMLVITGMAGSGKSALLGNILVYATPQLRDLLVRLGYLEPLPDDQRPPDNVFDATVLLTGMTASELTWRLAEAAGLGLPPTDLEIAERIDWLLERLRAREGTLTILADALDEAQDPFPVAAAVLRRVAALPTCRVVVGTRRSTREAVDMAEADDENLLDALGGRASMTVVTLGRDPDAINTYVRRRLGAARLSLAGRELDIDERVIADIADSISGGGREFLFARLAVHELAARPELFEAEQRPELEALLGGDHRALFASAVRRLTAQHPAFQSLLEALAFAKGRGLPRADRIWATVASTLSNDRAADIDDVIAAAAPYIMLDAEDGQSVYRLAHRTFQEYFLAQGDT